MDTAQKTDFLGKDAIFPLLLKLSVPAAVGMLVNALYNVVDTIFVGLGVGPLAIAALSIIFPLQMIVSAVAQAIGVGSASIISRRLGERRPQDAAKALGTAYASVFAATIVLVILIFAFMRPILVFLGASEAILPYAMDYAGIVAGGFIFFSMSMCASNLIRAEGNAKASMTGMIIGAALNTVLDPLFIFGFDMGVKGAAIATVISQMASCAFLFSTYFRKKSHLPLKAAYFRPKASILGESAILGLPSFLQTAGMSLLALIINNTLGAYGGDAAITTYGMCHKIISLVILPVIGIVQGFQPIAGYNYGARDFGRVKKSLRVAIVTAFCVSLAGYALMELAPRLVMGMFTRDRELIESSARVLRSIVIFIPLAAVQITGATYFQAIGKPRESFVLSLSRQFLVLIPLVLILPRFLGLSGIWYAFPLADIFSTLITTAFLIRETGRLSKLVAKAA